MEKRLENCISNNVSYELHLLSLLSIVIIQNESANLTQTSVVTHFDCPIELMKVRHSIFLFWNLQYYSALCFRWNFSVGQHDISFLEAIFSDDDDSKCSSQDDEEFVDWNIRVSISSGQVAAVRSHGSKETEEVLWRHQFDAPVAAVWRLNGGYIEPVSILSQEVMPQLVDSSSQQALPQGPIMYIGNVDYSSRSNQADSQT